MIDSQLMLDGCKINTNLNNNSRSVEQQVDRKQGFQVIWYYCYLKYFANKETKSNSKSSSKQTQQHYQSLLTTQITNTQQQQQQHKQPQQQQNLQQVSSSPSLKQQPLTLTKILQSIRKIKQTYSIQTIQRHSDYTINTIKQRALLSRNDRFFVIEPEQEIKQMQQRIRGASGNFKNGIGQIQSCLQDMLIELYSYYLNSKNVYLIYKGNSTHGSTYNNLGINNFNNNSTSSKLNSNTITNNNHYYYEINSISSSISTENRLKMILTHNSSQSRLNTSKDSKGSLNHQNQKTQRRSYGSLKSSLVRNNNSNMIGNKLLEEDSVLMLGNVHAQSLIGGEVDSKLDNKIQEMEIIDKFDEFDGLQLWNIKYKKIPHTFIKFKKQSWTKCLNLPIIHPSTPKTINQLPIIPKITKLNPSIDKLLPFVSLIKMLQKYYSNLLPSIDSIYQYNGMPYVFLQEDNGYGSWKWETNIGVLCYYIVFGNDQGTLSIKKVQRWVEQNGDSLLGRTIKEMTKRQKQKSRKRKQLLRSINNNNTTNDTNNITINTTPATNTLTSTQPQLQQPLIPASLSLQMLITKDENSDLAIW